MFDYNDLLILENHVLHDANSTWCHPIVVVSLLEVTMNASSRCCQLAPKHISAVGALRCMHWCTVLLNADVVLYVHCLLRMLCNAVNCVLYIASSNLLHIWHNKMCTTTYRCIYCTHTSGYFVLPSAFDILRYILSCQAIAIYDLPINLRYIYKRVSPLN